MKARILAGKQSHGMNGIHAAVKYDSLYLAFLECLPRLLGGLASSSLTSREGSSMDVLLKKFQVDIIAVVMG